MFSRLLAWFVGDMVRSYVVYRGDGIWLSRVESDDTWLFLVWERDFMQMFPVDSDSMIVYLLIFPFATRLS